MERRDFLKTPMIPMLRPYFKTKYATWHRMGDSVFVSFEHGIKDRFDFAKASEKVHQAIGKINSHRFGPCKETKWMLTSAALGDSWGEEGLVSYGTTSHFVFIKPRLTVIKIAKPNYPMIKVYEEYDMRSLWNCLPLREVHP
jgi:hypothetical protein